jgi:hypothetical protein
MPNSPQSMVVCGRTSRILKYIALVRRSSDGDSIQTPFLACRRFIGYRCQNPKPFMWNGHLTGLFGHNAMRIPDSKGLKHVTPYLSIWFTT